MKDSCYILGAGITGLAAGYTTGFKVFEKENIPGGISSSYYIEPKTGNVFYDTDGNEDAYRFDIGGGHWIFGADATIMKLLNQFVSLKEYERRSSVYFYDTDIYVPYPIQNNLRYLNKKITDKCLKELETPIGSFTTMKEWMEQIFGATLCELFFFPFHELYTAGLYNTIAPQDAYKSPIDMKTITLGATNDTPPIGYNSTFVYPEEGLNTLTRRIADKCDIQYDKKVEKIDTKKKEVCFGDGSKKEYHKLISTLPLNNVIDMAGIEIDETPDPYTSVLVLNIGAVKGTHCPEDHWLYIPRSTSGFHRIGFYSNVDKKFLPVSSRDENNRVSIYVEKAYIGGEKPSDEEIARYTELAVKELEEMKFIKKFEVADPNWIDVAYTWSHPHSVWRDKAIKVLAKNDIISVGRYGKWKFQGIAESIMDGLNISSLIK